MESQSVLAIISAISYFILLFLRESFYNCLYLRFLRPGQIHVYRHLFLPFYGQQYLLK